MSLESILFDLADRVPTRTTQAIFERFGLCAGVNSVSTKEKITSLFLANNESEISSLESIADWYQSDFLFHGEKAVYFYRLDESLIGSLFTYFDGIEIESNNHSEAYPCTINDDLSCQGDRLFLVDSQEDEGVLLLTFSSVKFQKELIELPLSVIRDDVISEYSNLEGGCQITSFRYRQFFDVVAIHRSGLVELRLDNPKMTSPTRTISAKDRLVSLSKLKIAFESHVSECCFEGRDWYLPDPLNLAPAIRNLYFSSEEGTVRLVKFTTNTGGSKELRATEDISDCCRTDDYNVGGTQAVGGLVNPYRVHVRWVLRPRGYIQLDLDGSIQILSERKGLPHHEALIHKSLVKSDYILVRNKLLQQLR